MSELNKATLDISPAGCPSCKRAIEHAGRHIKAVKDIHVDIADHKIYVVYEDTDQAVLQEIQDYVSKIGYKAVIE